MALRFDIKDLFLAIKNDVADSFEQTKWLPLLTAIAILWVQIGPFPSIPYIHVPFLLLCLGKNLGRHWSVSLASVLFLFYLPINIIITNPASVFQSWSRLCIFLFAFLIASPLFVGEYIAYLRGRILFGVLFVSAILSTGSFFCYFLGINYMKSTIDDFVGSAGIFGGLTRHSMSLAVFAGVSTLFYFYKSQKQKQENKSMYWLFTILSLCTVLFSASRSALLATLAGLLVMLYIVKKERGSFIKTLLLIIVGAMLTFPLWESAAEGVLKKQKNNTESGSTFSSRGSKWEARISEFTDSPVFGVGFSAQDPEGKDTYDKKTGTIEPGSSWLAILSMTGAIGFILVILMLLFPMLYLHDNPNPYNALLLGLFVFFALSFIAEGYIFAGGNPLCIIAWLVFGCANDVKEGYVLEDDSEEEEDE